MTGGNTPFSCATVSKKGRMRWTPELHKAFVAAVEALGPEAYPISVLESMGPCAAGLTRENIASHLQKYRRRIFNSAQRSPKRAAAAAAVACNDASLPLRRHSAPDFGNCSQLCLADGQPLLSACGHRFATQSATAAEAATFATMGGAFGGLNSSNTHGGGFGNGGGGDNCFLLPDMTPELLPHMPALEDLSCSDMDGSGFDGIATISGLAAGSNSGDDCSSWMAQQLPPAVTTAAAVPPFATSSPNTVTSPCYWPAASTPFSAAAAADAPKPTCTSPATGYNGTIAADAAAPQPSLAWLAPQPPICIAQPQPATQAAAYDQMHAALLKALAAPSSLPGQSPLGLKLDKQAVLQELQASLVAA